MIKQQIDCYLCNHKATQTEKYDNADNIKVECPECLDYELTHRVKLTYFDRGKVTDEVKEKIREFIKERYKGEPVRITAKFLRSLPTK